MEEKLKFDKQKSLFRLIAISVIAVIFVPVLYSGIYLSAFWDPYGNFINVPVAFVNLDKPVTKDGKQYNIGKDIENNLRTNTKIGWKFVSYDEAKKGVSGTSYYALVVIPEDFSAKIAESKGGKFIKPTIIYEANKGKNFVFAQVSERAAESIKSEISSNIQEEATKALASGLYDVKNSLKTATDGAVSLQSGTDKLLSGSKQLSSGLTTATNGSKQLENGLKDAASGEAQLSNGINSLIIGLNEFKNGLSQNTSSVNQLVTGAKSVSDGLSVVASQTQKADLPKSLTSAADGIHQINTTLGQVSSLLASNNQQSIEQAKAIITQLINNINNQGLESKLRTAATSSGTLSTSLNKLSAGAQQVSAGTSKLATTLADMQTKSLTGVNQLIDGANKLKTGSNSLLTGLNTAAQKTGELSTGLTALNTGSINLSTGLNSANDGALKLKDGLNNGYNTMNNSLKFSIEDVSKFTTNPLTLSDVSINAVKYYGEGLAPYFISLSLWLGALLTNIIISLTKLTKVVKYKFIKTYTGTFLAGSIIVMCQAIILSLLLINGLGLQTSNIGLFYIANMFIAVVFFSIMYGVSYAIGLVGTPILFVVFVLQLASSGGTFPIETAPKFFRLLSPYFPMTYSVEGLRMITSGINSSRFATISIILLVFMAIFYIGGFVINRTFKGLKRLKAEAD